MRKKKYGKCSICGKTTYLSVDHIPPKCCGNNSDTYYIQYTPEYLGKGANCKPKHSQNGLTFENICQECNNIMGSKYDTQLQSFRNLILSIVKEVPFDTKFSLEKVCKSVVGHFLSASSYDSCVFSRIMRDYYLNDNKKIHDGYSLLCTYYPYNNIIFSLNNYVVANWCGDNTPDGMISSLYFYPFAFIFCEKQHNIIGSDLFEMCRNKCLMLKMSTNDWKDKPPFWPAVSYNGHGVIAGKTIYDSKYKYK